MKTKRLSKKNYPHIWPFTVDKITLKKKKFEIFLFANGKKYRFNGACRSGLPLENIWKENPSIPGTRINVGPLFDLCRDWGWI